MTRVLPDHGPGRRPDVRPTQQNHLERLINKYGELTNVPPPRVRRWISTIPKTVTCLSVRYQIAQKIHAVTEQPEHRENDRFRDLIDLLLLRDLVANLQPVRVACVEIFEARDMHAWPPEFVVPDSWTEPYRALAQETGFDIEDVYEAAEEVRASIAAIDAAI